MFHHAKKFASVLRGNWSFRASHDEGFSVSTESQSIARWTSFFFCHSPHSTSIFIKLPREIESQFSLSRLERSLVLFRRRLSSNLPQFPQSSFCRRPHKLHRESDTFSKFVAQRRSNGFFRCCFVVSLNAILNAFYLLSFFPYTVSQPC